MTEIPDSVRRRTAKRRCTPVFSIAGNGSSVAETARTRGCTKAEVGRSNGAIVAGTENALCAHSTDEGTRRSRQPLGYLGLHQFGAQQRPTVA